MNAPEIATLLVVVGVVGTFAWIVVACLRLSNNTNVRGGNVEARVKGGSIDMGAVYAPRQRRSRTIGAAGQGITGHRIIGNTGGSSKELPMP